MNKLTSNIRIAYLVSRYPAVTHTFILNEIRSLRRLSAELRVASVSSPDRSRKEMSAVEKEETDVTFYIKARGLGGLIADHLATFGRRPGGYLRGLFLALAIGQFHPARTLAALFYFVEAVIFGRWMERESLTHFHTHFSSTVGLLARRIFPATMSMTIHGPSEFDDVNGFRLADKIAAASFVCAISNYARSQLMKISRHDEWGKIEVAPLGIDPELFKPREFRADPEVVEIVCTGRLVSVKAQHVLVAAVERLVRSGRSVRLRLIGDGPDRPSLERYVAAGNLDEAVVFEGWRTQDEILELYREADIFALASFAEGVPVALMEAMAMKVPCVATRITGIPELIRDGIDGLLVAPSSVDELAAALERLVADPELRRALGEAGRQRVLEKYDLATNTQALAGIFRARLGSLTRASQSPAAQSDAARPSVSEAGAVRQ